VAPSEGVLTPLRPMDLGGMGPQDRQERGLSMLFARLQEAQQEAPAPSLNPFAFLETLGGLLGGSDPVDIGPATQLQLKPLKEGYVIPDISVLLSREIFQLGDDPALCAKVAAAIESFTLRQYGLPNDEQEIFLATNRRTGELVGCVFLKRLKTKDLPGYDVLDAADIPLMESLAVNPKYSGQGIGSRLVKECENLALKWGYNKLLLQVYVENAGAIKFYKKRKYKEVFEDNRIQRPVGSSIFGIRWTEFNHKVMVKNLSKSFF